MPKFPITNTLQVFQLQRNGTTESYPSTPTYTNVNACVMPTDYRIAAGFGGNPAWQIFKITLFDTTLDLHNGDKLIDENEVEYIIDGLPTVISYRQIQVIRLQTKVKV